MPVTGPSASVSTSMGLGPGVDGRGVAGPAQKVPALEPWGVASVPDLATKSHVVLSWQLPLSGPQLPLLQAKGNPPARWPPPPPLPCSAVQRPWHQPHWGTPGAGLTHWPVPDPTTPSAAAFQSLPRPPPPPALPGLRRGRDAASGAPRVCTAVSPHPGLPGSPGPGRKWIAFLRALCQTGRFPLPPQPHGPLHFSGAPLPPPRQLS